MPQPARKRLYDAKWRAASKEFLAQPENQLCACGCGKAASIVDHKTPHRGDLTLFWDRTNWRPMHRDCHNRKTASRDGGFGNPVRTVHGCDKDGNPLDPSHLWNRNKRA